MILIAIMIYCPGFADPCVTQMTLIQHQLIFNILSLAFSLYFSYGRIKQHPFIKQNGVLTCLNEIPKFLHKSTRILYHKILQKKKEKMCDLSDEIHYKSPVKCQLKLYTYYRNYY
jgi:hypothetical protein